MSDETKPEEVPAAEVGEKRKAEDAEAGDAAPDAKKEKK